VTEDRSLSREKLIARPPWARALSGQRHLKMLARQSQSAKLSAAYRRVASRIGIIWKVRAAERASERAINNYLASVVWPSSTTWLCTREHEGWRMQWVSDTRPVVGLTNLPLGQGHSPPLGVILHGLSVYVCERERDCCCCVCACLSFYYPRWPQKFQTATPPPETDHAATNTLALCLRLLFQIESLIIVSDTWCHCHACYQ
jgi:hypothetical protein